MPKVNALTAEVNKAKAALDQTTQLADAEEKRRRDVQARIEQHKELQKKNQAVLNAATNQKEANAATAQLEQVTKIIADEERDLGMIGQRLMEIRALAEDRKAHLTDLEQQRDAAHQTIAGEREKLESELKEIRARRETRAGSVGKSLLSTYDRIRSKKRVHALFPINGSSCGNCDTAVPMQRRTQLVSSGRTDICEGCGVLLYAP
jgi:predicted  nucleic acid-binding Zn-ribbon protein